MPPPPSSLLRSPLILAFYFLQEDLTDLLEGLKNAMDQVRCLGMPRLASGLVIVRLSQPSQPRF